VQLQNEEASWSTRSQHKLVPESGHYIQFEKPDVVIAAVRAVIDSVRANPKR
jgi:pimeloyl-ACP methyl ester carboxylesterase